MIYSSLMVMDNCTGLAWTLENANYSLGMLPGISITMDLVSLPRWSVLTWGRNYFFFFLLSGSYW